MTDFAGNGYEFILYILPRQCNINDLTERVKSFYMDPSHFIPVEKLLVCKMKKNIKELLTVHIKL